MNYLFGLWLAATAAASAVTFRTGEMPGRLRPAILTLSGGDYPDFIHDTSRHVRNGAQFARRTPHSRIVARTGVSFFHHLFTR